MLWVEWVNWNEWVELNLACGGYGLALLIVKTLGKIMKRCQTVFPPLSPSHPLKQFTRFRWIWKIPLHQKWEFFSQKWEFLINAQSLILLLVKCYYTESCCFNSCMASSLTRICTVVVLLPITACLHPWSSPAILNLILHRPPIFPVSWKP